MDARRAHSAHRNDPTGLGGQVSQRCVDELLAKTKLSLDMVIVELDVVLGQTVIAHGPDGRDPLKCPHARANCSKHLGRGTCTLQLEGPAARQGDPPESHRLTCANTLCSRDGLPCLGMLCLYQNPLSVSDVHSHWHCHGEGSPGMADGAPSSPTYEGMLIPPGTLDFLGFSPADRLKGLAGTVGVDVPAPDDAARTGAFDADEHGFESPDEDGSQSNSPGRSPMRTPSSKDYAEGLAATVSAYKAAYATGKGSSANVQHLLRVLDDCAESYRSTREHSGAPGQTVQESASQCTVNLPAAVGSTGWGAGIQATADPSEGLMLCNVGRHNVLGCIVSDGCLARCQFAPCQPALGEIAFWESAS